MDTGMRFAKRFGHLRRIERARRYNLPEHPMVCQPGRITAVQLPLERMLAIRRVPLHPEQRVPRLRLPLRGSGGPVALPLERIGGKRDSPPPLAGK